ncbi:YvrJ family protein [Lysinibacillus mangiferihumi]|uniref:YvrJ family protein n=1 Tax=Lysinibacillus mangiferihumi TaxID=1130819 RepID=A0A4U2ZAZ5_9BACI|nr:YvrJ family protein [Lysinibacillus mangiferihumi]TKI71557.1 YvrJ family protein [Lysinibacillus mangiferihumi]
MLFSETPEWISIIGNFGFPISITIYLFIRFEKKIENLETSIKHLTEVIKDLRRD